MSYGVSVLGVSVQGVSIRGEHVWGRGGGQILYTYWLLCCIPFIHIMPSTAATRQHNRKTMRIDVLLTNFFFFFFFFKWFIIVFT